jgi:hypothetical protein
MNNAISPFLLPDLFFAGRAVLTFNNLAKGTHMTVRVNQAKDRTDRKKKLPVFFISISLLGDKEQGMVFAGTYFQKDGRVSISKAQDPKGRVAMALLFLTAAVKDPSLLNRKGVTFQHEGRCCSCSLPLTHPKSIPVGFGPDCLKKKLQDPDFALVYKMSFPEI